MLSLTEILSLLRAVTMEGVRVLKQLKGMFFILVLFIAYLPVL